MAQYELVLLGSPTPAQVSALGDRADDLAGDLELNVPADLAVRTAADADQRDPKAATIALYFGGVSSVDEELVKNLQKQHVPVVPVMAPGAAFSGAVPEAIYAMNACFTDPADAGLEAVAAVAFEGLGLLHRQRRVFLSYRRTDSRDAALQLHEELAGRGFDVFLDTHDIRPGVLFQEALWHRLADCDVVIMLDTPKYFESKWTKQELGRTQAKGIHILRVVWPGHTSSRHLSLSDTIQLEEDDMTVDGRLTPEMVGEVGRRTEKLRSRSVANRHREMAGKLKIEVERIGGTYDGIGAGRGVSLSLPNGLKVKAFPVVGVPTAETVNAAHDKANGASDTPCLVYDSLGMRPAALAHLAWLGEHITAVRQLKILDAAWELAEWDS